MLASGRPWLCLTLVGRRYQEELDQLKAKSNSEENKADDDGVNGTMDALDLLKRVFQLKRFMGGEGGNGAPEGGAAGARSVGGKARECCECVWVWCGKRTRVLLLPTCLAQWACPPGVCVCLQGIQ